MIVTLALPMDAFVVAENVTMLEPVAGFGANVAVTPFGNPAAEKFTLLANPFSAAIVIVLFAVPPRLTVRLPGDADNEKFGPGVTVSETEVV